MSLEANEVHLWWGALEDVGILDALRGSLSDEERRRGERFRRDEDAHAFLFRRAFRRRVLAGYVGAPAEALRFEVGPFGKPGLAGPDADLRFNATSSGRHVLIAVTAGRELGVDLERLEGSTDPEDLSRLAQRVLTARERVELARLDADGQRAGFLRLWTRKEAVLKWLGTGLSREPDTLEVGLAPAVSMRVLAIAGTPAVPPLATLDLACAPGLCASLVVEAAEGEPPVARSRTLEELVG